MTSSELLKEVEIDNSTSVSLASAVSRSSNKASVSLFRKSSNSPAIPAFISIVLDELFFDARITASAGSGAEPSKTMLISSVEPVVNVFASLTDNVTVPTTFTTPESEA